MKSHRRGELNMVAFKQTVNVNERSLRRRKDEEGGEQALNETRWEKGSTIALGKPVRPQHDGGRSRQNSRQIWSKL